MRFIDEAFIEVTAGNGGRGCLSFRREKFIPKGGPDGGDGGSGGNILVQTDESLTTLQDFRLQKKYKAKNGSQGLSKNKHGKDAEDTILKVPMGTLIIDEETEEVVADLVENQESVILARGGKGGFGNSRFKTSTNRAPRKTTDGGEGEKFNIKLELKVLADIGLLGMPNAGKSTLISKISSAKPKVADYPFTTLSPNLGVVQSGFNSFVVADIPGLIPGASEGVGLGIQFLKHLSRVKVLLHLVDISTFDVSKIVKNIEDINKELELYSSELAQKEQWIILNKNDLDPSKEKIIKQEVKKKISKKEIFSISAITGKGVEKLVSKIGTKIFSLD
ncbi:MAG: GTPase ObgE [Gammaproteobacteria bacterium]|tara:strand:- start:2150 stop:3151 length:1002 start_codon:yes stop_codon:yes gene_type:complete